MNPVAEDILMHYGTPRHSGRYPWGSGEDPYQRTQDFISRVEELKKNGWEATAENIQKEFGMTTGQYRSEISIASDQRKLDNIYRAKSLAEDGKGATEIGKIMGASESTVRGWLKDNSEARILETAKTIDFIREQVDKKGMVDIGADVERDLGITRTRFDTAVYYLAEKEGYVIGGARVPQANNPSQMTTLKGLAVPGTAKKDFYDYDKMQTLSDYVSHDGGESFVRKFTYPESMDSKRLKVRYAEEGGIDKDGIVELRRGVKDLSLGDSMYSQVRILVDGTHYIKGMAVYSDNMPDGVDVVFNTNKSKSTPALGPKDNTVLKLIKKDPDNPFGSLIKDADQGGQYWYDDPKTGEKKLGLINKRSDEGDWSDWKDTLPSQFLSKQNISLIKKQLGIAKADKQAEFDEYCSLTNPTVKKHLLEKFADECDSAAVHLKAAALPGQKYHVIIPVNTLKDNEIYAPQYDNGTQLALVRYPHGGLFEIPILKVNNKHAPAKELIGPLSTDAVGINKKIADQLSGADFDGDTVMCIPTHDKQGKVKISNKPPLKDLEGFDPKLQYGPETYKGRSVKLMTRTDKEMGIISNLITDMTLQGADDKELARAVKHSMVVIDAEKHKLDYKRSEYDNDIAALKKKYQPKFDEDGNPTGKGGGAFTIISRAKGEERVDKREGSPYTNLKVDPKTGGPKANYDPSRPEGAKVHKTARDDKLYYVDRDYDKDTRTMTVKTASGKKITYDMSDDKARDYYEPVMRKDPKTGDVVYTNKTGDITYKTNKRTTTSTRMAETDDAYTLVSRMQHPKEVVYADYANSMKALANQARLEVARTGKIKYDKTAKETYRDEVAKLMSDLNNAKLNTIKERAAQRKAASVVKAKQEADPTLKKGDLKKQGTQALNKYREEVGAVSRKKRNIEINDRQWAAIQAGAISENILKDILSNTDIDKLRERATPKRTNSLSKAQISKMKALSASYTVGQIADKMGLSPSTVSKYLKGVN